MFCINRRTQTYTIGRSQTNDCLAANRHRHRCSRPSVIISARVYIKNVSVYVSHKHTHNTHLHARRWRPQAYIMYITTCVKVVTGVSTRCAHTRTVANNNNTTGVILLLRATTTAAAATAAAVDRDVMFVLSWVSSSLRSHRVVQCTRATKALLRLL